MGEKRPGGIEVFREDEPRKVFIGGLTRNTNVETLKSYFGCYGTIVDAIVMTDTQGQSRGFGFVTFDNMDSVEGVLQQSVHFLDSKQVDVKRSVPKNMRPPPRQFDRSKKAFLGGLPTDLSEAELKEMLSIYGTVTDCTIMYDEKTLKSRGFGFIGFDDETVVDKLLRQQYIQIRNKQVEVKPARPRTHPSTVGAAAAVAGLIGPSMPDASSYGYGYGYDQTATAAALVAQSLMNFSGSGGGGGGRGGSDPPQKRMRADEASIANAASAYAAYGYGAYASYPGTIGAGASSSYDPYASYYAGVAASAAMTQPQQQQQQQYPYGYMPQNVKPETNGKNTTPSPYWPNYYASGYNGTNNN